LRSHDSEKKSGTDFESRENKEKEEHKKKKKGRKSMAY
jgi:hypothetical protein